MGTDSAGDVQQRIKETGRDLKRVERIARGRPIWKRKDVLRRSWIQAAIWHEYWKAIYDEMIVNDVNAVSDLSSSVRDACKLQATRRVRSLHG